MGKTLSHAAAAMFLMALCGGCSMCQQCELNTYSAYGGRWQRTDRDYGRVGSVFAPAGGLVSYAETVGSGVDEDRDMDARDKDDQRTDRDQQPDGAATVPPAGRDDPMFQSDEEREARERRLRELELEDIRYRY